MKLFTKLLLALTLATSTVCYGQTDDYHYKRPIQEVTDQWHKIELPNDIFSKLNHDLSDLRILGITQVGDTVEAPYILSTSAGKVIFNEAEFKVLNKSNNANGYFYTFEIPTKEPVNQIDLNFEPKNFDWLIQLEGSQNLQDWFTILDDYRIVAINNDLTDYKFTKLAFADSKYRYYRLCVKYQKDPSFLNAKITLNQVVGGNLLNYEVHSMNVTAQKERKQTIVDVEMEETVPMAYVKLFVQNGFDFYRPISIRYLTDSVKTEQGWKHNYATITSGTLSSVENSNFYLQNKPLKNLRIVIDNQNNQPLQIDSITIYGYHHQLIARFQPETRYHLFYGNKNAFKPVYDIERFANKIPENPTLLLLGEEISIFKENPIKQPLFMNEVWLWLIMGVIIIVLGWFTFAMMRKK